MREKHIFNQLHLFQNLQLYFVVRMGPAPLGKSCERGKVPLPWGWGVCFISSEISWDRRRASAAQRRCSSWTVAGRTERASCTEGPDRHTAVPSPGTHVCCWLSLWCWMFNTINKTMRDKNFGFCTRILALNRSDACLSGNSSFKWPSYLWIFFVIVNFYFSLTYWGSVNEYLHKISLTLPYCWEN